MFGDMLKKLRLQNNLTLKELGEKIGITLAAIGYYERNEREPSLNILCKIADYFGVTTDYLLNRSDYMTRDEDLLYTNIFEMDKDFISETNEVKLKAIETLRSAYFLVKNFLILGTDNSRKQYEIKQLQYLNILHETINIISEIYMQFYNNDFYPSYEINTELEKLNKHFEIYAHYEKEFRKKIYEIEDTLKPLLIDCVNARSKTYTENLHELTENEDKINDRKY